MRLLATLAAAFLATASPAAFLAAPSPAAAQSVLRFVPHADLRILDTAWTTAAITRNHGYLVYEPLFSYDSANAPRPQAVESYTASPDGLTWSFTLRAGQSFSDGTPITAKDAVASLERWSKRKASGQTMRARMTAIAETGPLSFEIRLKEPFGLVLETLADAIQPSFVLRARDAEADPFTQIQFREVIGSGPFQFMHADWVPGSKAVYRPNPAYKPRPEPADGFWGGKHARLDRVEWIFMPEPNTQVQALVRGEIDVIELPLVDLLPVLRRSPDVVVKVQDPLGSQAFYWLNSKHKPFDSPAGRRAIAHLMDQSQVLGAVIGNTEYEKPCLSVMACGSPNESRAGTEDFIGPNIARARELLRDAGYNGELIVLLDPADQPIMHQMALVLAQLMRGAGMNVDLQATDWGTVVTRSTRGDPPGPNSPGWHIHPSWAPGRVVSSPLTATQLRAPCNLPTFVPNPCDPELEARKNAFFAAATPQARQQAMDALQERFYAVSPYVLGGQFLVPRAWRANVTNIPNASEFMFWNVEKK